MPAIERTKFLVLGLVLISACSHENASVQQSYKCQNGPTMMIEWGKESAQVTIEDISFSLPPVRTASGARYADEVYSVWSHQGEVRLDIAADSFICRETEG